MTNKLPQGWVECELKDLCEVISKGTTPKNQTDEPNFARFLKAENVTKESVIDLTSCKYIDKETHTTTLKRSILKNNDILITIAGTLGRCAVVETEENLNTNQAVCFARLLNCGISPHFIKYYILSPFVNRKLTNKAKVTAIPNLTLEIIKDINVKLPPLNEQKRIEEKIEEEFGKIDEGVEKLKLVQEQIKQYRQSVLKAAFDGKLYKVTNWEEKQLKDIFNTSSGGTPKRGNPAYYGGTIPWLKSGELNNGIVTKAEEYITEEGLKNSSAKIFPRGSLLIALYGATVGKLGILDFDSTTNQAICCIYQNKNYNRDFLFYYLLFKKEYLVNQGKGGAQPNISQEIIKALLIPVPTLDEQKQIVAEIEKRFEIADEAERVIAENLEKAEQLKQSILKKAFEGRLVPQDPTDEPASVLLAKIKAERSKNV